MDAGGQTTGTRDEHYNLISVLYHALHGAETIEEYILDAEAAGDERLADFFREAQAMHMEVAKRAKMLLGIPDVLPEGMAEPAIPPGAASEEDADVPSDAPRIRDVQPEEQGRASPERPMGDVPQGGEPVKDVASPRAVPPDAPRTEDPPPRIGGFPPSPSEEPPTEEHLPRQGP